MKITPTVQRGIRIDIQSLLDWSRLQLIVIDASPHSEGLPLLLGRQMDMEEDWVDYVLPDIQEGFSQQVKQVDAEIKRARSINAESGQIFITPENVEAWYGTLNLARLGIETEHELSKLEDIENLDDLERGTHSALIKNLFYSHLQENLLKHIMSI